MSDDGTISGGDIQAAEAALTASPAVSTTTEQPVAASASAPATAAPATGTGSEQQPQAGGEPPRERWDDILNNQRAKAATDALGGWTPEQFREMRGWAERAAKDPEGFLLSTFQEHADPVALLEKAVQAVQAHATHGPRLASLAAKQLQARRGVGAEPQVETVNVQMEDGRVVAFPTGESVAKREAWVRQQVQQQVQKDVLAQLQPKLGVLDQLQAERAQIAQTREIEQHTSTVLTDLKTWPGMDSVENQKAVAQALDKMNVSGNDPRHVELALNAAYRQVVIPQLHNAERAKVLHSINKTAAAGTVSPGRASASAPKSMDEMSVAEALAAGMSGI